MSRETAFAKLANSGDEKERVDAVYEILDLPVIERTTDLGNAKRLVKLHGGTIRYVHAFKKWSWYNGCNWQEDSTGEIMRRAVDIPKQCYREAADAKGLDERQELSRHGNRTESEKGLKAAVALTRFLRGIAASPEDFDTDPWKLNTPGGLLNLQSGEVTDSEPSDMCSMLTGAWYDKNGHSAFWEQCLETWLPDQEVREFFQRAVGYSLIGGQLEEVLPIVVGNGANGKSRCMGALAETFGTYAKTTPAETLVSTGSRPGAANNDVARLRGARLVLASESDENRTLNEGKVKGLTGGDRIAARFLFGEIFEFDPDFTVWLSTNHLPIINGQDLGIWRRIKVIPFNVTIAEANRDKKLAEKLSREIDGILTWAVEGCFKYQEMGFKAPSGVSFATDEYRRTMDTLGDFLDDWFTIAPESVTTLEGVWNSYVKWAERTKETAMTRRALTTKLKERGFDQGRVSGGGRCWKGLRINPGLGQ